jgi:hypothetical protein
LSTFVVPRGSNLILPRCRAVCLLLTSALTVPGCASDPGDAATVEWVVTDSAGIQDIELRAPSSLPAAVLNEDRLLVSVEQPPGRFGEVIDGALGPSGVYALDRLAGQVFRFDLAGRYVTVVGKVGDGPGELRWPHSLSLRSDTVYVLNRRRGRLLSYRPDGQAVREVAVGDLPHRAVPMRHGAVAILTRQRTSSSSADPHRAVLRVGTFEIRAIDIRGTDNLLYETAGSESVVLGTTWIGLPYQSTMLLRTHPDGAVFGGDHRHDLVIVGPEGVEMRFRWPEAREPLTDREWDSLRDARLGSAAPGTGGFVEAQFIDEARPERKPWVGGIAADRTDGRIWVQAKGVSRTVLPRMYGFDLVRRTFVHVSLPENSRLLAVDSSRVLLLRVGELDEHSLEIYSVEGVR